MKTVARKESIELELTAANIPQQNKVAERALAVIKEKVTALLDNSSFVEKERKKMWTEAVNTTTRQVNMLPSAANKNNRSPREVYGA